MKNRIAELRKEMSMSQADLAERIGVGQTTISAWEVGRNKPDYDSLIKMSKIFVATTEYIMGYAEKKNHGFENEKEYQKEINKAIDEQITDSNINWDEYEEELIAEGMKLDDEARKDYEEFIESKTIKRPDTYEAFIAMNMVDKLLLKDRERILTIIRLALDK